jgi:hypothetical protein
VPWWFLQHAVVAANLMSGLVPNADISGHDA